MLNDICSFSVHFLLSWTQKNNCSLRKWKAKLDSWRIFEYFISGTFCETPSLRWLTRSFLLLLLSLFLAYIDPTFKLNSTHHVKGIKYLFMQKLCALFYQKLLSLLISYSSDCVLTKTLKFYPILNNAKGVATIYHLILITFIRFLLCGKINICRSMQEWPVAKYFIKWVVFYFKKVTGYIPK